MIGLRRLAPPDARRRAFACAAALGAALTAGCQLVVAPEIRSTVDGPPTAALLGELWSAPPRGRDLFWGVGGRRLAPDPRVPYTVIDVKRGGFSRGYDVTDPAGREWSVKFPPEAGPEVVASRLFWGVGYHQPPVYHLAEWRAEKAESPNPQLPARFRERDPDFHGLEAGDSWSYYRNPFVGTPQMNGLLVLHAMLGNSDLKDEQNVVYTLGEAVEGARRWYVARDLGQTFGRTGILDPPRGDVEVFEQTPFIRGVKDGYVQLEYRGRHKALFERITPADVRWICDRLSALTDAQLHDAFRAGGYPKAIADRFIRRLEQKIAEGRRLSD